MAAETKSKSESETESRADPEARPQWAEMPVPPTLILRGEFAAMKSSNAFADILPQCPMSLFGLGWWQKSGNRAGA